MKRRIVLAILAVFVFIPFVFSAGITGSANVTAVGQYLWRGLVLYDGLAIQPQLTMALNKFEITYWGSYDGMVMLEPGVTQYLFEESDLTLKFEDALPFAEMVSLNAGFISYMYHYGQPGLKYSVELFTGISVDTLLSPYLTFYYDTMLGNGGYAELGISHEMEIGPVTANASLSAGYNFSQYQGDFISFSPSFTAALLNISVTYDIAGSGVKITPAFIGQLAMSDQYENAATWSVALNYDFTIGSKEEKKEGGKEGNKEE
jgi:hypothetical protein